MILYPAIDLKDGQCVRLLRGEMDRGDGVQRRPGGTGAGVSGCGLRMAASGRPERRLRGRAGERRGGRGDPGGD